jgi:glyoxylate/hydroxypyruvate reductase
MNSAILLAVTGPTADAGFELFRSHAPRRDIRKWPNAVGDLADVRYVCAWKPPHGLLATLPSLRAVVSLAAGVDHILADPSLPDVPIVRAVQRDLTRHMTEYVVMHVLMHHRRQRAYDAQQRERTWRGIAQPNASEVTVGIMGLGAIGRNVAGVLRRMGFRVVGWSRTPKSMRGVGHFCGPQELRPFLGRTEILVCLLPHTPMTDGILNLDLFRALRHDGPMGGAFLINAARGAVQVDADIVAALDEESLSGATIDVFATEPLPTENTFWTHPKITITPHVAGTLPPKSYVVGALAQIARMERGLPPEGLVDRQLGY